MQQMLWQRFFAMRKDEKHTVPLLLHDVAHQLRVIIDAKVAPYKLTRQKWVALSILQEQPGISQIELAERLEIDRSSVGRLLDRMERSGLVRRQKDEKDRRVTRVFAAQCAEPVLSQLNEVSTEIQTVTQQGLSEDEHRHLVRLLQKVQNNLKTGVCSALCVTEISEQAFIFANVLL